MSHSDVADSDQLHDEPEEPRCRPDEGRDQQADAQELIDGFIDAANRAGIAPEPLRAQLTGGGTARTDRRGWYIKVDRSVAIGEDGKYYRLTVDGGLKERLSGVRLKPSTPGTSLGGGQDGGTEQLADFLTRALARRHTGIV